MPKHGKKYSAAAKKVAKRFYTVPEAVATMRSARLVKFDETVELAIRLGVDPKHADQMVRGTVVLPHGGGKTKRVAVIAAGEKTKEADGSGRRSRRGRRPGQADPGRFRGVRRGGGDPGHDEGRREARERSWGRAG